MFFNKVSYLIAIVFARASCIAVYTSSVRWPFTASWLQIERNADDVLRSAIVLCVFPRALFSVPETFTCNNTPRLRHPFSENVVNS